MGPRSYPATLFELSFGIIFENNMPRFFFVIPPVFEFIESIPKRYHLFPLATSFWVIEWPWWSIFFFGTLMSNTFIPLTSVLRPSPWHFSAMDQVSGGCDLLLLVDDCGDLWGTILPNILGIIIIIINDYPIYIGDNFGDYHHQWIGREYPT